MLRFDQLTPGDRFRKEIWNGWAYVTGEWTAASKPQINKRQCVVYVVNPNGGTHPLIGKTYDKVEVV